MFQESTSFGSVFLHYFCSNHILCICTKNTLEQIQTKQKQIGEVGSPTLWKNRRPEKAWEVGRTHQASDCEFIAEKKHKNGESPQKNHESIYPIGSMYGIFTYI